ncbi:MAG: exo-alpha-sialidase, partial [Bacteroidales bacterium]|nr:exo-alpha-sialidase [Bacteroidales bacterium]
MKKYLFLLSTAFVILFGACKKAVVNTSSNQIYYNQYIGKGSIDEPFSKISVSVSENKAKIGSIKFTLNGTENFSDIEKIKLYNTGTDTTLNRSAATLLGELESPHGDTIDMPIKENLPIGNNTLWLTCDISQNSAEGNLLSVMPISITIDDIEYKLEESNCKREVLIAYNIVYDLNQDNSKYYRIPAIVTASDGSLVAISDKRGDVLTDLPNTISIVARRSSDNGKSWSDATYIAKGDSLTGKKYGDAAVVLDKVTNKLIAVFVGDKGLWDSTPEEPQRLYISESSDCGISWSEPRDITEEIYKGVYGRKDWQGMFAGSGHALQLENGRLMFVVAARYSSAPYNTLHNYAVYSDDNGKSWQVSQNSPTPSPKNRGDEAKVVELDNGDILMSIRNPDKGYRKFAISKNKGETWLPAHVSDNLIEPACNGDIVRYNHNGKSYLIHSLPGSKTDRKDVTIYLSEDNGKTWNISRKLVDGMSAYSSLTILEDGTIGCLVEVGKHESATDEVGVRLIYYNFTLDWVLNK